MSHIDQSADCASAWACGAHQQNVGHTEKLVSGIIGGVLLVDALKRSSLLGSLFLILGGGLVYRAMSGYCPVYDAMELSTAGQEAGEDEDGANARDDMHAAKDPDRMPNGAGAAGMG